MAITLTELEQKIIKAQLKHQYSPFAATPEESEAYNHVIDMASALVDELDAFDETEGDVLAWFWKKYQEQQKEA